MLDDTIRKGQNKEVDNDMNLLKDKLQISLIIII